METTSYLAGISAAKMGNNINNSYPHNHDEFVEGYKSVKPNSSEDLAIKKLWTEALPEEYPGVKTEPDPNYDALDQLVKSKAHDMLILLDRINTLRPLIEYSGVISEEHKGEAEAINSLCNDVSSFFKSLKQ